MSFKINGDQLKGLSFAGVNIGLIMTKQSNTVTLPSLQRATNAVEKEFIKHGLYTKRLAETPVYLIPASSWIMAEGLYYSGAVHMPQVNILTLGRVLGLSPKPALRETLRHEFGHAMLEHNPELISPKEWKTVFGGAKGESYEYEIDDDDFITDYAQTDTEEDFCETLAAYFRVKGDIDRYSHFEEIYNKMKLIQELPKRIKKMGIRA
ncbi:MAG: hypothetical protein HN405_04995 [Planctomycetes bacterium]|nr:hypothetical protein [Planctomycetota bacterium]